MNYWINSDYRKVILYANDKEWNLLKETYNPTIVIDNGLTEINPNTETVMVFWPMFKNERCKTLKRLQALK
jgi:peptidyl-tRNA hydrolase